MCLKIHIRDLSIQREQGKLGSKHTAKFSKGTWHQIKIRERKGPSQGIIQKCETQERIPWPQNSRKGRQMRPSGKSGAPAKQPGTWQRLPTNSSQDKFYSLAEAWVMPAPSWTEPDERHFVIDSGASMHR